MTSLTYLLMLCVSLTYVSREFVFIFEFSCMKLCLSECRAAFFKKDQDQSVSFSC